MRILLGHRKTAQKLGSFEYSQFFCFCYLNFICHKINVVWHIYNYYMNQMSWQWWCYGDVILWRHNNVTSVPSCIIFKTIRFLQFSMQFLILIPVFFVWPIYYTFCCAISLICWFLNRIFHEKLVDENFGKPKFWQNFVIRTYIQASHFCCFRVSYCKPMFIINCKFLFTSGDCTITAQWRYIDAIVVS